MTAAGWQGAEPMVAGLGTPLSTQTLAAWVDPRDRGGSPIKKEWRGSSFAPRVPREPPFQRRVFE